MCWFGGPYINYINTLFCVQIKKVESGNKILESKKHIVILQTLGFPRSPSQDLGLLGGDEKMYVWWWKWTCVRWWDASESECALSTRFILVWEVVAMVVMALLWDQMLWFPNICVAYNGPWINIYVIIRVWYVYAYTYTNVSKYVFEYAYIHTYANIHQVIGQPKLTQQTSIISLLYLSSDGAADLINCLVGECDAINIEW